MITREKLVTSSSSQLIVSTLITVRRLYTSGLWKFFGFPAKYGAFVEKEKTKRKEVNCKLCLKVFKYSGNTTNLCLHLKSTHSSEFNQMEICISLT